MRRSFLPVILSLLTWHVVLAQQPEVPTTDLPIDGESVAITSWLVAGPFPSPEIPNAPEEGPKREGYHKDFLTSLGGEENARPEPGTTVRTPRGDEVSFERHAWSTDYVDLTTLFGRVGEVCAYIYAEVETPSEQTVYFHVGTNDAGKVWVGGELVVQHPADGVALPSQDVGEVVLPAGRTPVLVKIDQAGGGWGAFVHVWGASAHQRVLEASSPEAAASALRAFEDLRSELGDPSGLSQGRRDAYAVAEFYADHARTIREQDGWGRGRLKAAGLLAKLVEAVDAARDSEADPFHGLTGNYEAAYLSKSDGSAQPFSVFVPETYTRDKAWPLVVELHGAGGTHERGARFVPDFYSKSDSALAMESIHVGPMGRGRVSLYMGLGESDVFEVIDWIKRHYTIDERRIYLIGWSMGGHGTWRLGSLYPDVFAAATPVCGWPKAETVPNMRNLPIYPQHGAVDWVVPVSYSRMGTEILQRDAAPVVYDELPEAGHGLWAKSREVGTLKRMFRHTLDPEPAEVHITAKHPRYSRMYWAEIARWNDPHSPATLEAQMLPGNTVSLALTNVDRAEIDLPASRLDRTGSIEWMVNGSRRETERTSDLRYEVLIDTSVTVRPLRDEAEPEVRPYAPGSAANLYRGEPFAIVYGTQAADTALSSAIRDMAKRASDWLWPGYDDGMEYGTARVVADTDVTDEMRRSMNLILVGGPGANSETHRAMDGLPIKERDGSLDIFGEEQIPLEGRGYTFVQPNPEQPRRLLWVYASDDTAYYKPGRSLLVWAFAMDDMDPYLPDLLVEEPVSRDEHYIVRAVRFTYGWEPEPGWRNVVTDLPESDDEFREAHARALREGLGADFAIVFGAREPGLTLAGSMPFAYLPGSANWPTVFAPSRQAITFDLTGRELLMLTHTERVGQVIFGAHQWRCSPLPDSTTIDAEGLYRVASYVDFIWAAGGGFHFNIPDPEYVVDDGRVEAAFRRALGLGRAAE